MLAHHVFAVFLELFQGDLHIMGIVHRVGPDLGQLRQLLLESVEAVLPEQDELGPGRNDGIPFGCVLSQLLLLLAFELVPVLQGFVSKANMFSDALTYW